MGASLEIQKAVLARLRADAALTALLAAHPYLSSTSAVMDYVSQATDSGSATPFPYVVLGDTTEIEWDTDSTLGRESTITIHSWSRYRGFAELKAIMDAIKSALHDIALAVSGEIAVYCFWEFSQPIRDPADPEGLTQHGVQRFRIVTQGS